MPCSRTECADKARYNLRSRGSCSGDTFLRLSIQKTNFSSGTAVDFLLKAVAFLT